MSVDQGTLKEFDSHDSHEDHKDDILRRVRTSSTVTISPEVFESMFLAPKLPVKGQLRNTFGNPTPVALAGFLLCTTPLSMVLMGWHGSGGLGAAETGNYFFFGGVLMILGGIGEFLLGNTFPEIVFLSFGGFWLTFGATLVPSFNSYGAYSPDPTMPAMGLKQPMFFNSFAFFLVGMCILVAVYAVASIRTNICFFIIFILLIPTFGTLAGSFYAQGRGAMAIAMNLQIAAAALLFVVTLIGWYIFLSLVCYAVDFPIIIPLGDLSVRVKGHSEGRGKRRKEMA